MSPLTHDILKYALIAVFLLALGIGFWANGRLMRRGRDSGYRWFDPRRSFVSLIAPEFPIFLVALAICSVAGFVLANFLK